MTTISALGVRHLPQGRGHIPVAAILSTARRRRRRLKEHGARGELRGRLAARGAILRLTGGATRSRRLRASLSTVRRRRHLGLGFTHAKKTLLLNIIVTLSSLRDEGEGTETRLSSRRVKWFPRRVQFN